MKLMMTFIMGQNHMYMKKLYLLNKLFRDIQRKSLLVKKRFQMLNKKDLSNP